MSMAILSLILKIFGLCLKGRLPRTGRKEQAQRAHAETPDSAQPGFIQRGYAVGRKGTVTQGANRWFPHPPGGAAAQSLHGLNLAAAGFVVAAQGGFGIMESLGNRRLWRRAVLRSDAWWKASHTSSR
jgi:hypothetical protein